MKIVVVGCGKIGCTIIENLVLENHDIVAIDTDSAVIDEVTNTYDVMGLVGNGADSDALKEAGVEDAELFLSVTNSDELNMLACFVARALGAKHTIPRVRNPEYNDNSLEFMKHHVGFSASVNPEMITAREIYNIIKIPSAVNIETFARRQFEMVDFRLKEDSVLNGVTLAEMRKKYDAKVLVCAVQRDDEFFIPNGNFELKSGDKVGITASPVELNKLFRMLGVTQKRAHSVMIMGAGRISFYLAKMLVSSGFDVKVIDRDRQRCEELNDFVPEAVTILGDGTSQDLLLEEGVNTTDVFVALTGMDEENILTSCFAASHNVPKVITKVNRPELTAMAEKIGLECIVSPQHFVSQFLSKYARALHNSIGSNVEALYKLMDGKAEALEFSVNDNFEYIDIPLKDMNIKKDILIAGIIRGRKPIIPSGDDVIMAGDRVVVIAAGKLLNDLSDIIR